MSSPNLLQSYFNRFSITTVTVGSYAPVHQGHVDMVTAGVNAFLNRGYDVSCAVFSPNRDKHVSTKYQTEYPELDMSFNTRIKLMQEFLPGILPNNVRVVIDDVSGQNESKPLAFTQTITSALQQTGLKAKNIGIILGSDNVRSLESHVSRHNTVCVTRPGYNEQLYAILHRKWVTKALIEGQLIITDRPEGAVTISSTEIRKQMAVNNA